MQKEMKNTLHAILKEKMQKSSTLKKEAQEAVSAVEKYAGTEADFYTYVKSNRLVQIPFIKSLQEIPVKNKLFFSSLQIIHKIIVRNCISKEFIPYILEEFEKKVHTESEVRIRILQLLQPLIQDSLLVRGDQLVKLFKIGIQLAKESKDMIITESAAKVTVFHVIECVFERPRLVETAEKEKAKEDCIEIVKTSLDIAKSRSLLGMETLAACISDKHADEVIKEEESREGLLEEIIDFLLEGLKGSDLTAIRQIFLILTQMLKTILKDKYRIVSMLLEVFRIEIESTAGLLKAEFIYTLPHEIVIESLLSSAELVDNLLRIPDTETVNINGIAEIDTLGAKSSTVANCEVSLKLSKIIETATKLDDKAILPIFMPYFSRTISAIECSTETWPEVPLKKLTDAITNIKNLSNDDISAFDLLVDAVYQLAENYPKTFYSISSSITFENSKMITRWQQFFSLSSYVQDTVPELNAWDTSVEKLLASDSDVFQKGLTGACSSAGIPLDRSLGLLLSLGSRASDFPQEAIQLIHKIFLMKPEETAGGAGTTEEIVGYFLNAYFASKFSESIHVIILPELVSIFSEIRNKDIALAKLILQHISLGIRTVGETFGRGWTCVYDILVDALEVDELKKIVFEIVKIITDRMLQHLPNECLITTEKLLCVCCKVINEDNISFQALFCIRDLMEHAHTENIPREIQSQIFLATFCLLCSVSYDRRDDIRDSAIVQIFETIYFCQKHGLLQWEPLIKTFFKRFLAAAVYAKDMEIYSGEHEDISSESNGAHPAETDCICKGIGGCQLDVHPFENAVSERSLESSRKILLGVCNLLFCCFESVKNTAGFYSLWLFVGRVLVKFSHDPKMKNTVISALKPSLSMDMPEKYATSLFFTVSDICFTFSHRDIFLETVMEILKQLYLKVSAHEKKKETLCFFNTISHLLKNNTVTDSNRLTFLEFEAVEALRIQNNRYIAEIKMEILLEWLALSQSHNNSLSSQFIAHCIGKLSSEILSHPTLSADARSAAIKTLLSFHENKQAYPSCWKKAVTALQQILHLETKKEDRSHLTLISRKILGLPEVDSAKIENMQIKSTVYENHSSNKKIVDFSEIAKIKDEEKNVKDYLIFIESLSESLSKESLLEIYSVLIDLWKSTSEQKMHILYLATTKTLCNIFSAKKELIEHSDRWLLSFLLDYNTKIRTERQGYSFFQRQAVSYVLQSILDKKMRLCDTKEILKELTLCVSAHSTEISSKATQVLQHFISTKK
ncbi:hypothetical protein NEMIN01_1804 [Nematocida minor]|uniref:uncharacterized protein n=1 Tax=Nematocida minor TaxID=1912983 RepID=UPI00222095E4|nr:uncharacterized protein NEMIN01_1804 [Nematocida minor]KAI5192056.1 hypothetical protein NEMIN01_1804 [Nematocida minor]